MPQPSQVTFPEFGEGVSITQRGSHYGDGRWLQVGVESFEALRALVKQCSLSHIGVVTGLRRELPESFGKDRKVVFVDISRCAKVVEHVPDDQVITVETGIRLSDLNLFLEKKNQWFPISSGRSDKTLLETIESGDGGVLEHGFGGPRDILLGLELILSDGSVINCGGKVVKNVTGYDLTKMFVGSRSTLAIATSAHLRLFTRPQGTTSLIITSLDLLRLMDYASQLMMLNLPFSCLEIFDARLLSRAINLLDPDDTTGLVNSTITSGDAYHALTVQLSGPHALIEESIAQIKSQPFGSSFVTMPPQFEERILPALNDVAWICKLETVELSAAPRDLASLVNKWWRNSGQPPISIRPGSGRMRLFTESTAASRRLLDSLARMVQALSLTPVVSFGDNEYEYRVRAFAPNSQAQQLIKDEIKRRFDPNNCLNPIARV